MDELEQIKKGARKLAANAISKGYEPDGLYVYYDEDGNPLYAKYRLLHPQEGKYIRPFSKNANGEWTNPKEPNFPNGKPLYKLPDIKNRPNDVVIIVEGEKCVDALMGIGLLATTSGGSGSAATADWQPLQDRDVIIWRDNDDAGLKWQHNLIEALGGIAKTIRFIEIEKLDLPKKGDFYDWVENFKVDTGKEPSSETILGLKTQNILHNQATSDLNEEGDSQALPLSDDELIERLASLSPIEYDRQRKDQAKVLRVQPKTLDAMVKAAREAIEHQLSPFADIEPWHKPIEPAQLLNDITDTILRFIVLDIHQAQAAALWVACCWFVDEIQCAPIALINAPERACGKTQFLTVLAKLAPRSAQASGISASVLFRMVEAYKPTLFIDEIETILKDNEELRGLLNAGHTRESAYVWRSVSKGDDFEPMQFKVWGMKAVAGINAIKLAETVTSRSIIFELRRKRPNEDIERLRRAEPKLFETLARKLARFSQDYSTQVYEARPDLPDSLGDRDQDNWEPLLQVAMAAGGHWLETATAIAIKLNSSIDTPISSANELLGDIQEIFENKPAGKISTTELIKALCEDEEKSWATYNRGKPLSPRQLASKLKGYGIASKDLRFAYEGVKKGYEVDQFKDAFSRYLSVTESAEFLMRQHPPFYAQQRNKSLEATIHAGSSVADEKNLSATTSAYAQQRNKITGTELPASDTMLRIKSDLSATRNKSATLEASIHAGFRGVADCSAYKGRASEQKSDEHDGMEF